MLNLPNQYYKDASNYVDYNYDACGVKWSKEAIVSGTATTTKYYCNFIYVNNDLDRVLTSEGYIKDSKYYYYLKAITG